MSEAAKSRIACACGHVSYFEIPPGAIKMHLWECPGCQLRMALNFHDDGRVSRLTSGTWTTKALRQWPPEQVEETFGRPVEEVVAFFEGQTRRGTLSRDSQEG